LIPGHSVGTDGRMLVVSTLKFLTYFFWDTEKSTAAGETYWFFQKNMISQSTRNKKICMTQ